MASSSKTNVHSHGKRQEKTLHLEFLKVFKGSLLMFHPEIGSSKHEGVATRITEFFSRDLYIQSPDATGPGTEKVCFVVFRPQSAFTCRPSKRKLGYIVWIISRKDLVVRRSKKHGTFHRPGNSTDIVGLQKQPMLSRFETKRLAIYWAFEVH